MKLSTTQKKALLALHLTHDFIRCPFRTYEVLARYGLIILGFDITITPAGIAYCDAHHADM